MTGKSVVAILCVWLTCAVCTTNAATFSSVDRLVSGMSVGPAGVWGYNENGHIYFRRGSYNNVAVRGSTWDRISGQFFNVIDVGTNIMIGIRTGRQRHIYYRSGITSSNPSGSSWVKVSSGDYRHVTISPSGNIWAIDNNFRTYWRNGVTSSNPGGTSWTKVDDTNYLEVISAGVKGVWAVNNDEKVYYRSDTHGDQAGVKGTAFVEVTGKSMKYIASGSHVIGLDDDWTPWERTGISSTNPTGTGWSQLQNIFLVSMDTWSDAVWAVGSRSRGYHTNL